MSIKQEVETLLKKLPENISIEDIQYQLYLIEKIQQGLFAADTQKVISQIEAEEHLSKWLIQ